MSAQGIAAGPFAHDRSSVDRIMLHVCLALLPTTAWGLYLFGWPAIYLWLLTCASAVACEAACLYLLGRPLTLDAAAALCETGGLGLLRAG